MQPTDLQYNAMRIYQTLTDYREDWRGGLVLCYGPGCAHAGGPSAVSIAGGATLFIDTDAVATKSAMRAGYLDFVVNNLDEALRTLKNEVRQHRPLSVGLIADEDKTLAEIVERGLQPDMHLIYLLPYMEHSDNVWQIKTLLDRGMKQRNVLTRDDSRRPALIHNRKQHCEYYFVALDTTALRNIDATLLTALPVDDIVRRRWIDRVPKYLREARSAGRWIWLNGEELESLAAAGLNPQPQP